MSVQAMSWVFENSEAQLGDRLCLLSIANHADREGANSWPSYDTIAAEVRMSRRNVIRCVQNLERDLRIVVLRSRGDQNQLRNVYLIVGMAAANRLVGGGDNLSEEENGGDMDVTTGGDIGGDKSDTEVVTSVVTWMSPKQKKEPKEEPVNREDEEIEKTRSVKNGSPPKDQAERLRDLRQNTLAKKKGTLP